MMVDFTWNGWLSAMGRLTGRKSVRKPRQARTARIEALEERTLLTANLPVAVADTFSIVTNTTLNGTSVLANDTDADGDTIDQAVISATPANGNVTLATDGTFTYIPNANFVGTDSFTYFAVDSANGETSQTAATVTITVLSAVNQAPTATAVTLSTPINTALNVNLAGTDPENDPLTFAAGATAAANGTVTISPTGALVYTPNVGFNGTDTFSFNVNDGTSTSADATVTVNVGTALNVPPVGVAATVSTALDTAFTGTLTATDADGDPLTFAEGTIAAVGGTVAINPNGSFTFTPTTGFTGNASFSFQASDGSLTSDNAIVTVQVGVTNSLPVVSPVTLSTNLDTALNGTLTATDADGDPLTFAVGSTAATGGIVAINPDGTFTFTPTTGFVGAATFSFIANDGTGNSNEAIATVNVGAAVNVAPVGVPATVSTAIDTALNGTLTATDANGDPLTFAVGTIAATGGTVAINPDGTFTFTPTTGFTGNASFSFQASDGTLTSDNAIVTVQVGVTNSLPVVTPITLSTGLDTALNGTLTATDADGDPLTFSVGSTAATGGTVVINPNGTFTFTPTTGFTGAATFSFIANDGTGNSNEAIATVNVASAVNVAPVGVPATVSTAINTVLNGTLTATDANGDPLTFSAGTVAATGGTVVINQDGTFAFTPTTGFTGNASFSFQASDGTLSSADTVVTVQVGVANTLPVVTPITLSTGLDTALNGTLTATDADGDPLTFSVGSTAATGGTVVINPNGTFTFTPTTGFTGAATFSFIANDGTGNSNEAIATVNVASAVNVAPIGVAATVSTAINTALNGTLTATDVNGDPLTFSAGTIAATGGTVVINPNGTFTFTPTAGFTGNGSFSFKASDGTLSSADTIVTVQVGVTNTLPVVTPITLSTNLNTVLNGTLTATDANGDPLTFSAGSTAATGGTVVINPNGTFTFTPTTGFIGAATFSFRANDGIGNSTDAIATINVGTGTNVAPVGVAATLSTAINTALNGTLTATDANGDPLTFSAGTVAATGGTVVINPNGTFTFTPTAGFTGNGSFSFKASDGTLSSADTIVTVQVGVTNTLPVVLPVTLSTNVNTVLTGTLTGTDVNGDPLTFAAGSTVATGGTVVINPDGTFTFTPTAGFTGAATFSYRANDGIGNSADATVTINVGTATNIPPVAIPQTVNAVLNTVFNGTLTATDVNGDPLTFSAGTTAATNGTVVINNNGTFTYTPNAGFTGTDFFSFKANDGQANSPEVLVTVVVAAAANTAPTVITGNGTTTVGTPFVGSLSPLATDAEGNALTFVAVTQPANGTLSLSPDGTFTYTPNVGFTGTDSFTFKANDSLLDSTVATFNLTVTEAVDEPFTLNLQATGTIATKRKLVVPLDSSASLTDIDPSVNFGSASIVASIGDGADRRDKVFVIKSRNAPVQVRGKRILVNGSEVATFSGGRRGQQLQINFNGSATADTVTSVLQRIGARTTRSSSSGPRTITLQVNAGSDSSSDTIIATKV